MSANTSAATNKNVTLAAKTIKAAGEAKQPEKKEIFKDITRDAAFWRMAELS